MKYLLTITLFVALSAQAQTPKSYLDPMEPGDNVQFEKPGSSLPILKRVSSGELVVEASKQCTLSVREGLRSGDVYHSDAVTLTQNRTLVFGAQRVLARPASSHSELVDLFVRLEISDSLQSITSIECKVGQSADSLPVIESQIARGSFDKKLPAALVLYAFRGMNARLYSR